MRAAFWRTVCGALALGALVSGCGTAPRKPGQIDATALPSLAGQVKVLDAGGNPSNIRLSKEWAQAFNSANDACKRQSDEYERLSSRARSDTFALATIGAIATSIIAPSYAAREGVGKATAAAAGGLSGATTGILSAQDKTGASAVALSTAYGSFRTELDARSAFLKSPPVSVDDDFGKLRALEIWCSASAPNPAASQLEQMQRTQLQQSNLIQQQQQFMQQQQLQMQQQQQLMQQQQQFMERRLR